MSQSVVISIAGVRVALPEAALPAHLRAWVAPPRASDLALTVRQGRPLASPHAFVSHSGDPALEVSAHAGRYHFVTRRPEGSVLRSAVFDPAARLVEVVCGEGPSEATADRGLLEWLVMHQLARRGGFVVNACAVLRDRRALLFAGPPGSGRTTVARLLRNVPGVRLLSDDRVAVYPSRRRGFVATSWPWCVSGTPAARGTGALQIFHRIHRTPFVLAEPLTGGAARQAFDQVAVLPTGDPEGCEAMSRAAAACSEAVPTIRLGFPPDARLARYVAGPSAQAPRDPGVAPTVSP